MGCCDERGRFIWVTVAVLVAVCAALVGLTIGLATPALEDGGSPTIPPPEDWPWPTEDTSEGEQEGRTPAYPANSDEYESAAVSTDTETCSTVGKDILGNGGSATDAAIAAMFCVGVVNCHSTGVGGGHFATIYDYPSSGGDRVLETVIAREMAANATHRDMFNDDPDLARKGGLSIAVPGEVAGFWTAHEKFGKTEWSNVLQPSIQLARDGFPIGKSLAGAIKDYENDILNDPNLSEVFTDGEGNIKTESEILINTKLADSLQRIADDPSSFYDGSLASDIVADIAEYGGIITEEDLRTYTSLLKGPLHVDLTTGDLDVYSPTTPSSGAVYSYIMNILDGYAFDPDDVEPLDEKVLTYHRIAEAFKFAYAKRSDLGDEDYVDVKMLLQNMTSPEYGEYIRSKINDTHTQDVEYYEPSFDLELDAGTAHLSVFGPDGSAVAMTSTINLYFGSNVMGSRTGILFNDEMDDFSIPGTTNSFGVPASPANYIEPGKRPMSSMCPAIVMDNLGEVNLITGGSGGTRITTAAAQVTMNTLWFGMRADEATEEDRIHHQLVPHEIKYESETDPDLLQGLADKGHDMVDYQSYIGVVQTIHRACGDPDASCIHAVGDGRKDGIPDGF